MTKLVPPPAPAAPSSLDDRIVGWLAEGQAIERTITREVEDHQRAQEELAVRLSSVRDALDRMREAVGNGARS